MKTNGRQFFTLIELLVVIAIISILAAMLMPALSSAKKTSRQICCMNNIKQITLANFQYANDYDGYIPGKNWEGYNVALFDGSAAFQTDRSDFLEYYFSEAFPNVVDGRDGYRNTQGNSAAAWMYINCYNRSQQWINDLFR